MWLSHLCTTFYCYISDQGNRRRVHSFSVYDCMFCAIYAPVKPSARPILNVAWNITLKYTGGRVAHLRWVRCKIILVWCCRRQILCHRLMHDRWEDCLRLVINRIFLDKSTFEIRNLTLFYIGKSPECQNPEIPGVLHRKLLNPRMVTNRTPK